MRLLPPACPWGSSTTNASKYSAILERPIYQQLYVGHLQRLVEDRLEQFHSILASEGRKACDHLVYDASQAPPVDCLVMALFFNDFRS
jgi:hypothetical protein